MFDVQIGRAFENAPHDVPITSLVGLYAAEELMNKRIVFLCNLKEAKFAGQLSQGMLLAASEGEKLSLLTLDRDVPDGSRVS